MKKLFFNSILTFIVLIAGSCEKAPKTPNDPVVKPPSTDVTPVANFSFIENGNFAPSKFTFTETSTNAVSYFWDFGDGTSSTLRNPTHIYSQGGIYNVTLKVISYTKNESVINKTIRVRDTPSKLKINSLTLTSYPLTKPDGGGWDSNSGPDVFFVIKHQNGTISFKDYRKSDIVPSDLPYTFRQGLPITLTGMSFRNEINFYDFNPIVNNAFMGGYYFVINNDMPKDGSKYPNVINFNSSTSQLKFHINVEWE